MLFLPEVDGTAPPISTGLLAIARAVWKQDVSTSSALLATFPPARDWLELAASCSSCTGLKVSDKPRFLFGSFHGCPF